MRPAGGRRPRSATCPARSARSASPRSLAYLADAGPAGSSARTRYGRHWADANAGYWSWLPGPLRSLLHYHWQMWDFHSRLSTPHSYQSSPWGWLVDRPAGALLLPEQAVADRLRRADCVRTVLDVGTPALWWAFAPAVLWAGWIALARRDWRGWAVLVAFAAGWLTWFSVPGRTMFIFYMTPLVPFLVIGVTLGLGAVLGAGPGLRAAAARSAWSRSAATSRWSWSTRLAVADPVRPAASRTRSGGPGSGSRPGSEPGGPAAGVAARPGW